MKACWKDPMLVQGKNMRRGEEADKNSYKVRAASVSYPPCTGWGGEEGRRLRIKGVEIEAWEERVVRSF